MRITEFTLLYTEKKLKGHDFNVVSLFEIHFFQYPLPARDLSCIHSYFENLVIIELIQQN